MKYIKYLLLISIIPLHAMDVSIIPEIKELGKFTDGSGYWARLNNNTLITAKMKINDRNIPHFIATKEFENNGVWISDKMTAASLWYETLIHLYANHKEKLRMESLSEGFKSL